MRRADAALDRGRITSSATGRRKEAARTSDSAEGGSAGDWHTAHRRGGSGRRRWETGVTVLGDEDDVRQGERVGVSDGQQGLCSSEACEVPSRGVVKPQLRGAAPPEDFEI